MLSLICCMHKRLGVKLPQNMSNAVPHTDKSSEEVGLI